MKRGCTGTLAPLIKLPNNGKKKKKKKRFCSICKISSVHTVKSRASPRFKFVDDHAKPGNGRSLGQQSVKLCPVYFPNVTRLRGGGRLLWNGQMLGVSRYLRETVADDVVGSISRPR